MDAESALCVPGITAVKKYGKEDLVWIIQHGDGILHI